MKCLDVPGEKAFVKTFHFGAFAKFMCQLDEYLRFYVIVADQAILMTRTIQT